MSKLSDNVNAGIVAMLVISGGILGKCTANLTGVNKKVGEVEARQYAKELNLDVKGVSCSPRDSDGDGYVSCTISTNDKNDPIVEVECLAAYTITDGCRPLSYKGRR